MLQRGDVFFCQADFHDLIEKSGCFGQREAQIVRAQFRHLAAGAQAWQRRIGTAGDDEVHVARQMVEQKGERLVNGLRSYE
jgi:hypothetical protein